MSKEDTFPIIREVWADIRSLTTDFWRLLSVAMGVFALVVSAMLIPNITSSLLTSYNGWFLMLFLFMFTSLSLVAARSLDYDINRSKKQVEKYLIPIFAKMEQVYKGMEEGHLKFTQEHIVEEEDMPVWLSKKHNIQFFYMIELFIVIIWVIQPIFIILISSFNLGLLWIFEILAIICVVLFARESRKLDREEVYTLKDLPKLLKPTDDE